MFPVSEAAPVAFSLDQLISQLMPKRLIWYMSTTRRIFAKFYNKKASSWGVVSAVTLLMLLLLLLMADW